MIKNNYGGSTMNYLKPSVYPIVVTLLIVFLFGCEDLQNPHQDFSDVLEKIPDVQLIPGAENATITVRPDRIYSFFLVTVDNVESNRNVSNGTFNGWCLQKNVPIETGKEYTGVKLYSTERDKWINRVSYIVNNRPAYEHLNPGLSWSEIQVAIWVMFETRGYRLPENFSTGLEYNAHYVQTILNDVKKNGVDFKPGFGDIRIVITNAEQNEQTIGIECREETAWGGNTGFNIMAPGQWWYIFDTEDPETQNIWAGQTINVGNVTVSAPDPDADNKVTITIELTGNTKLQDVNEPVKIQGYDEIPGNTFTAPPSGLFSTYKGNELVVTVDAYKYYAIHIDALVCTVDPL